MSLSPRQLIITARDGKNQEPAVNTNISFDQALTVSTSLQGQTII